MRIIQMSGILFATFLPSETDFSGEGWIYPGCVKFKPKTIEKVANETGMGFKMLDWKHPRQQWAAFYSERADQTLLNETTIHWNNLLSK